MKDTISLTINSEIRGGFIQDSCDTGRCLLHAEGIEGGIPLKGEFVDLFINAKRFNFGPLAKLSDSLLRKFVLRQIGLTRLACERVMGGELNMVVGIDTNGGDAYTTLGIEALMQDVRLRGGKVVTFADEIALSAGAKIFLNGDEDHRFLLPDTDLMFHVGSNLFAKLGSKKPYLNLIDLLVSHAVEGQKDVVRIMCEDANRKSRDTLIEMSGDTAVGLGFGQIPHIEGRAASLSDTLNNRIGLGKKAYRGTSLECLVRSFDGELQKQFTQAVE